MFAHIIVYSKDNTRDNSMGNAVSSMDLWEVWFALSAARY